MTSQHVNGLENMASKSLNVVEHEAGRFNELLVLLMKNNKVGGNCIMFNCLKIDFCLNKFGLFIL